MESFQWPEAESLPKDIKPILTFNGIRLVLNIVLLNILIEMF